MLWNLVLVGFGVLLLAGGGELLVKGAIQLGRASGLSPMVVGLTVVAFATSCPELAATLTASLKGSSAIAVGNVLGSNIANIGLILGLAALLRPLAAHPKFLRREVPFMVAVSLLLFPLFADRRVSRLEGLFLLALLGVYLVVLLKGEKEEETTEAVFAEVYAGGWGRGRSSLAVAAGIVLLVAGAQALIEGAAGAARLWGVSERVIGLTLVAVGTSLPELASSLVAVRRRQADIVVGNVIGSNVFNILCILGVTGLTVPMELPPAAAGIDFWVMLGFSLLVFPLLHGRLPLGRLQGALFVALYGTYVAALF